MELAFSTGAWWLATVRRMSACLQLIIRIKASGIVDAGQRQPAAGDRCAGPQAALFSPAGFTGWGHRVGILTARFLV